MFIQVFVLIAVILAVVEASRTYDVKVWKMRGNATFPESSLPLYNRTTNTAIGFSGSGLGSFATTLGYLVALENAGIMQEVRYIGGSGANGLATLLYTYAEDVDTLKKGQMVASVDLDYEVAKSVFVDNLPIAKAYKKVVTSKVFEPLKIKSNKKVNWRERNVEKAVKKTKGELDTEDFIAIPDGSKKPFPIVVTTLVGASKSAAVNTAFEITPLYVGSSTVHKIPFGNSSVNVGGFVEPTGFIAKGKGPKKGIAHNAETGSVKLPLDSAQHALSLRSAAVLTGYNPSSGLKDLLRIKTNGVTRNYWSPVGNKTEVTPLVFTSGDKSVGLPLISFLQRKVKKIVLFINSNTPLNLEFNPSTTFTGKEIDANLASFFGFGPSKNNQVFSKPAFSAVVKSLQSKVGTGKGIISTFMLTTVENKWYEIKKGQQAQITFVYLYAPKAYTKTLKPAIVAELQKVADNGKFPHFNHKNLTVDQAKNLGGLASWTVKTNLDYFKNILNKPKIDNPLLKAYANALKNNNAAPKPLGTTSVKAEATKTTETKLTKKEEIKPETKNKITKSETNEEVIKPKTKKEETKSETKKEETKSETKKELTKKEETKKVPTKPEQPTTSSTSSASTAKTTTTTKTTPK